MPTGLNNVSFFRQFSVLFQRHVEIIGNDVKRVVLLAAQPVVMALLIYIVVNTRMLYRSFGYTQQAMFAIVCSCLFMGLFNSIQEICGERAIVKREYLVNLRLSAYIASKMAVQFVSAALQGVVFIMVCTFAFSLTSFFAVTGVAILTIFASSSLGLLISAIVKTNDKAMLVTPFVLIIQLLFAGVLFLMDGVARIISFATLSHWASRLLGMIADLNSMPDARILSFSDELDPMYDISLGNILLSAGALVAISLVCGVVSAIVLRSVSKDTR